MPLRRRLEPRSTTTPVEAGLASMVLSAGWCQCQWMPLSDSELPLAVTVTVTVGRVVAFKLSRQGALPERGPQPAPRSPPMISFKLY